VTFWHLSTKEKMLLYIEYEDYELDASPGGLRIKRMR